jgi:uncharacterized SAM-binding protein YcdF (DUF218 family)
MKAKKILWGLLTRRERLGLSWTGWGLLTVLSAGFLLLLIFNVQPFLTETRRVPADVFVMEGWVPEYTVRAVVSDFRHGSGRIIYTTGGPITGSDGSTNENDTLASVGAGLLEKYGVPRNCVQMVPAHEVGRDRTYTSAVALRNWFEAHGLKVRSFNILTEDAHARRTRLLFQEAFGPDVAVGVIAIPDPDYDPRHWWRYSEGVRTVLGESIAYLYARLLFHPPAAPPRS